MGRYEHAILLAITFLPGLRTPQEPVTGTWVVTKIDTGDVSWTYKEEVNNAVRPLVAVVKKSEFTLTLGSLQLAQGRVDVMRMGGADAVDIVVRDTDGAEKRLLGLYAVKNGQLTLCFTPIGMDRPTAIRVDAERKWSVMTLERAKNP